MNFWILGALLLQYIVTASNRIAGAAFGFALTTIVLLWGGAAYLGGGGIALFGFNLSGPVFLGLCIAWYGHDLAVWKQARAAGSEPSARDRAVGSEIDVTGRVAASRDGPVPRQRATD